MELVASLLGSVVADAGKHLCDCICSKASNSLRFQAGFNDLEEEMKLLIDLRSKVENESAWTPQVSEWLKEVEELECEVNSMQEGIAASNERSGRGCLNCSLHNKELVQRLKKVQRLRKVGTSISMVAAHRLARRVEHIPGPSIECQATATQSLAKIMSLLNDDGVGRIGVWGMGGVGKTTLVKNLNNKLRDASSTQSFGIVIWITVSKEMDLKRIQVQIAQRLNMAVDMDETTERMAIKLFHRLKKENKFLLIFDDVWKGIHLDSLGVPQPEDHVGCKIVLTTRSLDVCRVMRTDVDVRVDVLNDSEAWNLFCQNVGDVASLQHIKPLAEAVAKECGGLPLAIIVMGTSMRGKTMVELWEDALNELQQSLPCNIQGIEDEVYKPLKWSYDLLQGKNIKSCFLYCSLFPEDFSIEISELVQCWLAEGLLGSQQNYRDAQNRALALIENLKNCCLLEPGDSTGTVKMHDVVRDVAIWISSSLSDGCKFLVRSGIRLTEIPMVELSNSLKRVSFMNNVITELPAGGIECLEASTLFLQGNQTLVMIPEGFLVGFQQLRVLNLCGTQIQRLPSSLLHLSELRALLLKNCTCLEELPPLGGLSQLQLLDCDSTAIKELPQGMEQLSNLRELNLSRTKQLKTFRAGVVSRLPALEVLNMTDTEYKWGVMGNVEEGEASFDELGSLRQLTYLHINLKGITPPTFEYDAWISRLKSFKILVGSTTHFIFQEREFNKTHVIICDVDLSGQCIGWLLPNSSSLLLGFCSGQKQMLENLVLNNVSFACLTKLTITNSDCCLRPENGSVAQNDLLPSLEELYLRHLTHLENVSDLVSHLRLRLSKLKVMEVLSCPRLKYLLSFDGVVDITLENLEDIRLSDCVDLGDLFVYDSGQLNSVQGPVVPNLQRIYLRKLPTLKALSKEEESWPSIEELTVNDCDHLKRLPLNRQSVNSIKKIRGELEWWRQLEWGDEEIRSSLQPFFLECTFGKQTPR
ncbi:disease resistance protein At4g27190-like [Vitis riparia]|uniref:disease resistance protein At4g27190-like n=1 Tax=Vitis riparia TaxID=96939 RepID=UPI00155B2545|nr:disease resistance protein At4g27190-like [Vitis riparia]